MLLLASGLLLLASGSSCLDNQTILPGQLGQISDAVLTPCNPYQEQGVTHQCLILANPYLNSLKIFDATDNQFVLSPIGYFPLVLQAGNTPYWLATQNNRTFSLDPVLKQIFEIPGKFISPVITPILNIDFSPSHFTIAINASNQVTAFLAKTEPSSNALVQMPGGQAIQFNAPIEHLQLTGDQKSILVVEGLNFHVIDASSFTISKTLSMPVSVRHISQSPGKVGIALTNKTVSVIDQTSWSIEATSAQLEANPAAIYFPSSLPGKINTCCNGQPGWLGVLLVNGKLLFMPYENQSFPGLAPEVIDVATVAGVSPYVLTNPLKLLGVQVPNPGNDALGCERRLMLVYEGSLFNVCEGSSNLKRVDQSE